MLWIDITDPKYALFFHALLPHLRKLDSIIITTRKSAGYTECADLLEKFGVEAICIGGNEGYGGDTLEGKFLARIKRQKEFVALFARVGKPRVFLTGASAEGAQVAFGLGIPVVHFSDTPMASFEGGEGNITLLSRLTLPLSSVIFYPFVLSEQVYRFFGIPRQNLIAYNFIDVALWLEDLHSEIWGQNVAKSTPKSTQKTNTKSSADSCAKSHTKSCPNSNTKSTPKSCPKSQANSKKAFLARLGFEDLSEKKPLILAREEEYKAHYVRGKYPLFYEILHALARENLANIMIMPRYEKAYLQAEFGAYRCVRIAKKPLFVREFYPHIDMLLGGGGTMNLESSFLGIPTLSTRSLLLYHDKYLLDNALMRHAKSVNEALDIFLGFSKDSFAKQNNHRFFVPNGTHILQEIDKIITQIKARFYTF